MILDKTDFHSHILPGIDDGSKSLEESLAMAEAAWELGFTEIVATPHFEEGSMENDRDIILKAVHKFNEAVRQKGIPLKISSGCEVTLSPEIPNLIEKGSLMTLRDEGAQILVEFPFNHRPMWEEDIIYRIRLLGLTPVIAHPERYAWFDDIEEWIRKIKAQGALIQGNLSSIAGKYGPRVQKNINALNRLGLVDCWGSDAHSVRGYKILKNLGNFK